MATKNTEIQTVSNTEIQTVDFNIPEGFICTVDLSTEEGKISVATALNGAEPLKDYVNKELFLKDVVTTSGVRAVSGSACTNTYLILADGKVLFSQSDGVARSIRTIVALWAGDFGENGRKIKCIEQRLNNGNSLKTIVPLG